MRRPPLPKRPPGQVVLEHDWRWSPQPGRLPWGYLAVTGPHEQSYVAADRTVDGDGYECSRCGCVRLNAWVDDTDEDGRARRRWFSMHGFDWSSLAPMSAPSCEVWERPAVGDLDEGSAAA